MMDETNETLEEALQHQEAAQGLPALRVEMESSVSRLQDATIKVTEAENMIQQIEANLLKGQHDLENYKRYHASQLRRRDALEKRVLSARDAYRAAEDEELGL